MDKIQILSLNVRGMRDPVKRSKIFSYISKFKSDIILLQEAHVLQEDYERWTKDWGKGDIYLNCFNTQSAGQIIMLAKNENVVKHEILVEGRCHILEIKRGESSITLMNIYAPNKDTDQIIFYRKINEY